MSKISPPRPRFDTLIIGAGLAGLSCAKHLGRPSIILEREPEVGGTARSFRRGSFSFDVTGHWLHLRDPGVQRLVRELMGDELVTVARRAAIYSHGVRTPYPFQANTYGLPAEVISECVLGYFAARERAAKGASPEPRTFEDFIRQRMGDGIAKHFMLPYNEKLWTVPPSQMDFAWCERFVPTPTPEEVVRGAVEPGGAGHALGYNATFSYPRQGGIGQLSQRLADSLSAEVRRGAEVVSVDWQQRRVRVAGGEELTYGTLVSTMPLTDLVRALAAPPEAVHAAAAQLRATSVTYWDIGLPAPNGPADAHWIYYPEASVPFYRAGSPSAAVPSLAPPGQRSLYVEVSHPRGAPASVDDGEVLAGLRRVGLVGPREEPVLWSKSTVDCAYVIMDRAYGAARALVLAWLEQQGILSVGRYGAWTYDSMEGAMVQGRAAAERLSALTASA
jgi:protoporphyrinogen oxidase